MKTHDQLVKAMMKRPGVKAEVERIWLPFGIWMALACARLRAADGALPAVAGSLYLVGEARALLGGNGR